MTQSKKLTITVIILSSVLSAGTALAFDRSFHPTHKFVEMESIGPEFKKSGYVLDQDKVAKEKTSEQNLQIPSGVNPHNPTGSNPNIKIGADRK